MPPTGFAGCVASTRDAHDAPMGGGEAWTDSRTRARPIGEGISVDEYVPKNANIAVRFFDDARPSEPFMNNELSFLGLGLSWPDIMYTPSE